MFNIKFIKSINSIKDLHKEKKPEVILCGRSNVGKSSFINSLSLKKNIAKTSSTPGKTRMLNYYLVEEKLFFVDLPGFGYAKAPKTEIQNWQKLIEAYLFTPQNIILAFHFVDSRHKPTDLDLRLNKMLKELTIPYIVILSKADKLKQSEKYKIKKEVIKIFPELDFEKEIILYSSVKGIGHKIIETNLSKLLK